MIRGLPQLAAILLLGLPWMVADSQGASPFDTGGSIVGLVLNDDGIPQMGAAVSLFNRYDRLVHRALTDGNGVFVFANLTPDIYSLRINLASYLPALKQNILVTAGGKSVLSVNLASVLSSIELVYSSSSRRALMSEDWKSALRTAESIRPVLRFGPKIELGAPGMPGQAGPGVFSDTRAIVRVSAGDTAGGMLNGYATDLGTAFALATSLFGKNSLQVSGNLGASQGGVPATGLRTSFGRDMGMGFSPEVSVTLRQLYLPGRTGYAAFSRQQGGPTLRSMNIAYDDGVQLTDSLRLDFGGSMEAISFLERLNILSPYARVTYDMGSVGAVEANYSAGMVPSANLFDQPTRSDELAGDLAALSLLPRMSVVGGDPKVQSNRIYEVGYRKVMGSRSVVMSGHYLSVSNTALTMLAPSGLFMSSGDALPDLSGYSSVFNGGSFEGFGMSATLRQRVGEHFAVSTAYGNGMMLAVASEQLRSDSAEEFRQNLSRKRSHWGAARLDGMFPATGTALTAVYQVSTRRTVTPGHQYLTQRDSLNNTGLNFLVRQPMPMAGSLPGRMELVAEMRNLLAQGYVSVYLPDGRRILLMNSPRSLRGGVSFIF